MPKIKILEDTKGYIKPCTKLDGSCPFYGKDLVKGKTLDVQSVTKLGLNVKVVLNDTVTYYINKDHVTLVEEKVRVTKKVEEK